MHTAVRPGHDALFTNSDMYDGGETVRTCQTVDLRFDDESCTSGVLNVRTRVHVCWHDEELTVRELQCNWSRDPTSGELTLGPVFMQYFYQDYSRKFVQSTEVRAETQVGDEHA